VVTNRLTCIRLSGPVVAAVLSLLWAGPIMAQVPPPLEEIERAEEELRAALDESSKELIDDYLEVLEDLGDLLTDYADYIQEKDAATWNRLQPSFERFADGLDDGTYAEDMNRVVEDIDALLAELEKEQEALDDLDSRSSRKLQRLLSSLTSELISWKYIIQANIYARDVLESNIEEQIRVYLREALTKLEHYRKLQPLAPLPPDPLPEVPIVPPTPVYPDWFSNRPDYQKGKANYYTDTIRVTSKDAQIYILNPIGELVVTGTGGDRLIAELVVEIAAASRAQEEKLVSQSGLKLTSDRNGYTIESVYPTLTDSRTKIVHSSLRVTVPTANSIMCENSHSPMRISDIKSGLLVKGNYSPISIHNVRGKVQVENAYGPVILADVRGPMRVINSAGKIEIQNCLGDARVRNESGAISITDCKGDIRLAGTGLARVSDHSGSVTIENSNGAVEVENVNGNLTAFNANQPLLAENIAGTVSLENSNSWIGAYHIDGALEIMNRQGPVEAEYLRGPIDISSSDGTISLAIRRDLAGPSTVYSKSGTVVLAIPESANLLLTAVVEDGELKSMYPMDITEESRLKRGQLKFGKADNQLSVRAKHSTITIEKSR